MTPPRSNLVATSATPSPAGEASAPRVRELEERVRQLEAGLERRACIECAKGILMERHDIGPREAFELLRSAARNSNQSVFDLANLVIRARTLLPIRPDPGRPPA